MAHLWNFPLKRKSRGASLLAIPITARGTGMYRSFLFPSSINYSDANEQRATHRAPSRMRATNAEGTDRRDKKGKRGGREGRGS